MLKTDEGISTNILADRLDKLWEDGIVEAIADPEDGRKIIYRLTKKGIDLAPVLVEMIIWASRHEDASPPAPMLRRLKQDRSGFLAEVRKKWEESAKPARKREG
jgi:DNA-binding HxlR family transcriptional regulator